MKPTVKVALEKLIKEARVKIPFNLSFEGNCDGRCEQCPYKRLEWLDIDLGDWETRLKSLKSSLTYKLERIFLLLKLEF